MQDILLDNNTTSTHVSSNDGWNDIGKEDTGKRENFIVDIVDNDVAIEEIKM